MSITDPIEVYYYERRGTYLLTQGRETFYDKDNKMWEWETSEEAVKWARTNYPNMELILPK